MNTMNLKAAKHAFYAKVAGIIRDNPTKGYRQLMVEFGLSWRSLWNAIQQEAIHRPKGRKKEEKK